MNQGVWSLRVGSEILLKVRHLELGGVFLPSDYCLQLTSLYIIVRWEAGIIPVGWLFVLVRHDELPQANLLMFIDI